MSAEKTILLIGQSNAGKTVFGAQLFGRVQHGNGSLRAAGAPESIKLFKEAFEALGSGREPEHTSRDMYGEIVFPLVDTADRQISLVWPDYGGEQVSDIMARRELTQAWMQQVQQSDGWLNPYSATRVTTTCRCSNRT